MKTNAIHCLCPGKQLQQKEFFFFLSLACRSERTEREPLLPFLLSNQERKKLDRKRNWRALLNFIVLLRNRGDELWVKLLLRSPLVYGLGIVGVQLRFPIPFYWYIYTPETHILSTGMSISVTVAGLRI